MAELVTTAPCGFVPLTSSQHPDPLQRSPSSGVLDCCNLFLEAVGLLKAKPRTWPEDSSLMNSDSAAQPYTCWVKPTVTFPISEAELSPWVSRWHCRTGASRGPDVPCRRMTGKVARCLVQLPRHKIACLNQLLSSKPIWRSSSSCPVPFILSSVPGVARACFCHCLGFLTYITIKKETSRPLGSQLV